VKSSEGIRYQVSVVRVGAGYTEGKKTGQAKACPTKQADLPLVGHALACPRPLAGVPPMPFLLPVLLLAAAAASPYDIVIRNARIVDGTARRGTPATSAFAAAASPPSQPSGRSRAPHHRRARYVVAPGFIDMLGQSELTILVNPHLPSKIYQGITTEITAKAVPSRRSPTPWRRRTA